MTHTFTPENRAKLVQELISILNQATIQTLRQAARQWGWPLKGTAKAEVVEQMVGYLGDAGRMSAAIEKLPEDERDTLTWLNALGIATDPAKPLQTVLAQGSGRQMTQKAVGQVLQRLMEHGLLFFSEYNGYQVPGLFAEWLPPVDAPRLLHGNEPGFITAFTLAEFNQHVHHLLSAVEADRPEPPAAPQPAPAAYMVPRPAGESISPRPGLVAMEMLNRWGYQSADERNLARFLLEQITAGGLCQVTPHGQGKRLDIGPQVIRSWEEATPAERLGRVRQWWLQISLPGRPPGGVTSTWNELDLALGHVKEYTLRPTGYWTTADQISRQVAFLRLWLLGLVAGLRSDTWYSIERLENLAYQLHRDLLSWEAGLTGWRWHQDKTMLDPNQMSLDIWRETYGQVIRAWFSGPATWLAYVQVGHAGGRPVAFRYLAMVPAGELAVLSPDTLRFPTAELAVLRNTWQAGELRQLLRRIAVETARDREITTYRVDIGTFRQTLRGGIGAAQLDESFAAAGFPLPAAIQAQLRAWQEKAGRHQLYDNLATIEFGTDMHPEEVKAIASLGSGHFYQVSPRCLIVLDPDFVPSFVDELRRRGYTPQVIS